MIDLSAYSLEKLRDDGELTVSRGRRAEDGASVLLLSADSEHPSPSSIDRIKHTYSLRDELDSSWAIRPLELLDRHGIPTLLLDDPGGDFLDDVLRRSPSLEELLRLAIAIARALGDLHARQLIHRDVKPANIMANAAMDNVWLTGLGLTSRVPRYRQLPDPPEVIAGTLAYMAPEQTGRMNRSIDSRSDLYSLGVTLYEMFVGMLPFEASDAMGWVHCHIARLPVAPSLRRSEIPEPLSAIILKLLAKTPEERYQTAAGVEADLRQILTAVETRGAIESFPLGTRDVPDRLLIPEKLYGREREVDLLLAAFDRVVSQGTTELVLVSGYSGVGKSSVVNELHKALVLSRGFFASGKFDQYKRDIPYATLAQAFQMLVRQILAKSEAEVDHWRQALLEALGPNGQLIVNLIPEVEFVIGKQPSVADLPPQEARNRFQSVFSRFLGAFATAEHPLALFLDDLQWQDAATLELLERLATDPDVRHVLLIGAYRDNEVSPSHPLMRTLAAIREAGIEPREIVLSPLDFDDIGRLVADVVRCESNSTDPLAQLVHEKTGGNPFFAIQFLMALAEESLLRFDGDASRWICHLDRIRAKGYSDNVVDLMVGKLRRLSDTTQAALQQLACLGNVAEIATLSVVFGQSEEEIHTALLEAVRTGLILRLEGSYAFLHDRIQEAAYALIPESERAGAHLRIGRVLLASVTADGLAEHLFDVANQLNRGAALLVDHDEKVKVAAINLRAGRKAKASSAFASARAYFAAGMALLDESNWTTRYELTFSLWLERVECELLCGNSEKAGQLIAELLPRGATKIDEASVYCLKIQLDVLNLEYQQAVATGLTCLRELGIDVPAHPTEDQVQAEYEALWHTLDGRTIESLIDLPLLTDPELVAATQVISVISTPAYFVNHRLYLLEACRMARISVQHGTSRDSAFAYVALGVMLGPVFHRYGDGYRFAKLACDLVEKHGFVANRGKIYASTAVAAAWTQPIASVIDLIRTAVRAAIETGDLIYACYGALSSITCLFLRDDPLDMVWRESEMALDLARKARYADAADIIVCHQRFIASMQDRSATVSTFSDAQFNETAFEAQFTEGPNVMMICWYWIIKLKARFLAGNYTEALRAADKAKQLLRATAGQIQQLDYYYYAALTVSALYETASADEGRGWRELLREHQEQLREWAEINPSTFADKHALVLAEIGRLEKRDAEALRLYEHAIHLAHENGFVQNEGLAHELAAQYCLARKLETAGYAHLRNARNCYDRWGAHGKVKQLDEFVSPSAQGTNSGFDGHKWLVSRAVGRRDHRQSIAGTFK